MGLFRRGESRSISYQDVWGSGGDWTAANSAYSATNALKLGTVVACVRRRQALISQIPFSAYRDNASGFAVRMPRQPLLIERPSAHVTKSAWFAQMSVSRDLWGNAFGLISSRDAAGYPTSVDWLNPDHVKATTESNLSMAVRFKVNGQDVSPDSILMIPALVLPGSPIGISPLASAGLVELGRMAQDFGSDWFKNGAVPSSLIVVDAELDEHESGRLRDAVTNAWRGRRPAIVGSGVKFEQVQTDPASTSEGFLGTMHHIQSEICQVFGVPIEALGIGSKGGGLTYANREQAVDAELVTGLNPDIVTIQEHLSDALPKPQHVIGNPGALKRSDLMTRYQAHAIGLASGFLTVDEVRALEDLPPLSPSADPPPPVDPPPGAQP